MTRTPVVVALTVATLVVLAWRWRSAMRTWDWVDRLGAVVVVPATFAFWALSVSAVLGMLRSDWNAARLAPTFALVYGYRLYYPVAEGPILATVYGPLSALAYLPAALFRTPTAAVLAGGLLQVLFVFAPLLLFVWWTAGRGEPRRPLALACGLAACLLMIRYRGSKYWVTMVEPDGPALAFGLLACLALVTRDGRPPAMGRLALAAAGAVVAVGAKQIAAPVPVAIGLAVWLQHGRALLLRYLLALVAIGGTSALALLWWLGEPMIFNTVVMPTSQPWYRPGLAGLAHQAWVLVASMWDVLAALAVCLAALLLVRSERAALRGRPWLPALLVGLLLVPTGAVGVNKIGADQNSFHSLFYFVAALAALLAERGREVRVARALGYAFCALAIVVVWRSDCCHLRGAHPPLRENNQQLAYDFAVRHPGEAYFPWQPLATLLAEGRLDHFEYGMMDRYMAGYRPTPEHVRAHVPPRLRWIAARNRVWTFQYFPDFSQETSLPELPGWAVRTRPPP